MKDQIIFKIASKLFLLLIMSSIGLIMSSLHSPIDLNGRAEIKFTELIDLELPLFEANQNGSFVNFEASVQRFMNHWGIKGASIAIAKDGKMVYQNGFGYANTESNQLVNSKSRFRIASISKLITATAIMQLVERGFLNLDDKIFGAGGILSSQYPEFSDPAYQNVTVRHLLNHRAGWSSWEPDPMFMPNYIADKMGVDAPAKDDDIIRFVLEYRKLRYTVGGKYAYSNVGYVILAKVIEQVSNQDYEFYVKKHLFDPLNIKDIELGASLSTQKKNWEVNYYDYPQANKVKSFDNSGRLVDKPNGGNYIEALHGAGGWIASAPDLLKFILAVDGKSEPNDILSQSSINQMLNPRSWSYAMGWSGAQNGYAWRSGTLAGTSAYTFTDPKGFTWVVLMNSSVWNGHRFTKNIRYMMENSMKKVKEWPSYDLYDFSPKGNWYLPLAAY